MIYVFDIMFYMRAAGGHNIKVVLLSVLHIIAYVALVYKIFFPAITISRLVDYGQNWDKYE
jgi:hypothetical protein